jgi:hypothetical protein
METLHGLILEVWKNEEMPEDWKKWILCPIHKKGDIKTIEAYARFQVLMAVSMKLRVFWDVLPCS